MKLSQRLEEKIQIDKETSCWIWHGRISYNGYGVIGAFGKTMPAHRAVYFEYSKNLPKEIELHHLCGNKLCVNPDHLQYDIFEEEEIDMGERIDKFADEMTRNVRVQEEAKNKVRVLELLVETVQTMQLIKPNDRSEKDRYVAIAITDLEKVRAFFAYFVA